jgi:hypothetical protein
VAATEDEEAKTSSDGLVTSEGWCHRFTNLEMHYQDIAATAQLTI